LPGYYNLADVFVLVSRRTAKGEVEGYGIVVAEAALCGVPSVVSTECGIAESMSGSKAALVIEPDDPLATANAILRLLSDDTLRAEMGCSARRYILETSTWAQRMSRYHQILVDATRGS
jgi:phosphatidylinositol alpha-1,6-mannosyltransferase